MSNNLTPQSILIKGPRIIDASQGLDVVGDLLVKDGKILSVGNLIAPADIPENCRVISGDGLVACAGFIDLHCHLREPGFEYKETIATGTQAAARGGFTSLCCMPNTDPAIDNAAVVEFIKRRAADQGVVRVFPIGCVTKERKGKTLAEMEELASAGVVAFSDDGDPVYDDNLMRLALAYSQDLGLPIINHCQEHSLSRGGVMAEGWVATLLGLPGIPAAAEEAMIARDIALAELTGGRLHVAHLSTSGSVALVRQAKERGIPVTAEVCPHHLTITDQWALGGKDSKNDVAGPLSFDTSTKVYPPLRSQHDVEALVDALAEGVIDCVATDHAPHDLASKQVTYQDASFGISVLETALGSLMQLVHQDRISLSTLIERLTVGPARILGPNFAELPTLKEGTPADVVLFDPNREWRVDPREFASKGKNTPLEGTTLKGRVVATMVAGEIVFQESALTEQVS
ncbi:MAG: dihydroorotase [Chloroflexi bacterium]|nr:dihydroorotase [Chloroflexota bacterium]MDA1217901.1 dihydroorotase [Chloroflexota bacterium]